MAKAYTRNHYVPQWYQKGFIPDNHPGNKFYYLDLNPESFVDSKGRTHKRNALLHWGPQSCFKSDDLYTMKFGGWESTDIERRFFGEIDSRGRKAISFFQNFQHPNADHKAFYDMILYLSVQKLRTPKGFEYLSRSLKKSDKNDLLLAMQRLQQLYCAIWAESVWVIADASQSDIKFILSDHPVTVFNMGSRFPETSWSRSKDDPEIWLSGTHTLFPLNQDKILILTNHSWIRNPYGNPEKPRPNPNPYRDAVFDFTEIQTGRMLSEMEVMEINYIIKKRAYRYIASVKKEWLYPENDVATQNWQRLGKKYLLMPDPRSVKFITGFTIGYSDNSTVVFDGYGRRPWESGYQGDDIDEIEWKTFQMFQGEYARLFGPKRRGVAFDCKGEDDPEAHLYRLELAKKYKSNKTKVQR